MMARAINRAAVLICAAERCREGVCRLLERVLRPAPPMVYGEMARPAEAARRLASSRFCSSCASMTVGRSLSFFSSSCAFRRISSRCCSRARSSAAKRLGLDSGGLAMLISIQQEPHPNGHSEQSENLQRQGERKAGLDPIFEPSFLRIAIIVLERAR